MYTQMKNATNKIHSIHVLPNGNGFSGKIEVGRQSYHFAFAPKTAASGNGKLVLTGGGQGKTTNGTARGGENRTAAPARHAGKFPGPAADAQTVPQIVKTAATGSQRIAAPDRFDRPHWLGSRDVPETSA